MTVGANGGQSVAWCSLAAWKNFHGRHSNTIHLLLCVLGGVLSFLPLITHDDWDIHFDALTHWGSYRSSSLVAVTLLIPMGLDTLLEFYYHYVRPPMTDITFPQDALSVAEKLVLLAGLAIAPFVGAYDLSTVLHLEVWFTCVAARVRTFWCWGWW